MKNFFYALILASAVAGCQNAGTPEQTSNAADTTAATPMPATADLDGCYILAEGKDTTFVRVMVKGNGEVMGTYNWIPWEKDSARGTFKGKKEGDLLKVVYDYMIEGSQQQQEMILKLTGDQLAEGKGELTGGEDGGLIKIKDVSKLEYQAFTKTQCK